MRLYSEKVHFVYEFLQNADDAGLRDGIEKQVCLGFVLRERSLLVWNDGHPFDTWNIQGICSIGLSNKNLSHIGTFGIGFKAVYVYTDCPEIHSDQEHFCIRDRDLPQAYGPRPGAGFDGLD